jgi:hypothetical protein
MVERLLDSMTTVLKHKGLLIGLIVLILSGCSSREVVVDGSFPEPVIPKLPLTIGVLYTDTFKNHELVDDGSARGEASWRVSTGVAQVEFWSTLLPAAFNNVIYINSVEDLSNYQVDAVFVPTIVDVQYAIPLYTNVKVYELWMRYRLQLVEPEILIEQASLDVTADNLQAFADWTLSAYGKTPTAFMQSDIDAVNLAAVMALRDAGANFITSFGRVPSVNAWLATALESE